MKKAAACEQYGTNRETKKGQVQNMAGSCGEWVDSMGVVSRRQVWVGSMGV